CFLAHAFLSPFLYLSRYRHPRALHSFPTRALPISTASPPDNSLGRRASAESRANSRKPYALSACGAEKRPSANCTSARAQGVRRSEEHTSELQSPYELVCRLLLEKKNKTTIHTE